MLALTTHDFEVEAAGMFVGVLMTFQAVTLVRQAWRRVAQCSDCTSYAAAATALTGWNIRYLACPMAHTSFPD